MVAIAAPPAAAPTLTVYADAQSAMPLLTLPLGGSPVYGDGPESGTVRRRIAGLIAHEALPPGWERNAGALKDLGRLLAATYSVTLTERGQEYRIPKPRAELGWFFRSSLRGNIPLTVVAVVIAFLGTLPIAMRQPALLTGEWLLFIGVMLSRVYYPPWSRLALVLPEDDAPGEYRMLALARYDLRLAPLMRRRTWAIAPRRFFLWVGMVIVGGILVGIALPRATTIYQSLGFGCLVLLLPFMQIVRGWIGDRKYVLFESLLDDYDSLPRYNPAVDEFIRHVIAEPEKAVIAEELFQTVGPDSPFAADADHRPVETTFAARKVTAAASGPLGRVRDAAFGRTRRVS
ncbi:MAG: hypothetical protein M3176_03050 [Chloroflexota bacterium]|nr:hypothetical protein [Chloroflexota bacterium]